jgi:PPM family protein phosphatase
VHFVHASRASQGARNYQEDSCKVLQGPDLLVAVLADGMGGHAGGALASGLACIFFMEALGKSSGEVPARLTEALELANAAITHEVAGKPELNGMGCTLVGTAFGPRGIEWVSVGDSPLYLVRRGELVVLNEDHSLAPEIDKLAAMGKISKAAALADPRRHFLRSALTGGEIELIDRSHRPLPLQAGDTVILASDGIHSISHDAIARLVTEAATPDDGAEALLSAVEAAGDPHQDNTTVVVVEVSQPR